MCIFISIEGNSYEVVRDICILLNTTAFLPYSTNQPPWGQSLKLRFCGLAFLFGGSSEAGEAPRLKTCTSAKSVPQAKLCLCHRSEIDKGAKSSRELVRGCDSCRSVCLTAVCTVVLWGPRMEVPSGCSQVSLTLIQRNPGLSPSMGRRLSAGPARPKGSLQHVRKDLRCKIQFWPPWQSELIRQYRSKHAVGKSQSSSLFYSSY